MNSSKLSSILIGFLLIFYPGCVQSKFGGTAKSNQKLDTSKAGGGTKGSGGSHSGGGLSSSGGGGGDGSLDPVTGNGTGTQTGTLGGGAGDGSDSSQGNLNGGGAGQDNQSSVGIKDAKLFEEKKSLDLYTLFDVSGSLSTTSQTVTATDPECKRWPAFLGLLTKITQSMDKTKQLRLTLVTFSDHASAKETITISMHDFNQSSFTSRVESVYKSSVCTSEGSTNPHEGFLKIKELYQANVAKFKLELESLIFFSDGIPSFGSKWPSLDMIKGSASQIRGIFGARAYSILLGNRFDLAQVCKSKTPECPITPLEFIKWVSPNSEQLRSVDSASDLESAFDSMLK